MKIARYLGFDFSTTAASVGVRDAEGSEGFVAVPMTGATLWHGEPAFEPSTLPGIILEALGRLRRAEWIFSEPGHLCASVRQHDMVLMDKNGLPLTPFITWQCHAATEQVNALRAQGAETVVGRIEPRFILPKLMWALAQEPALASRIQQVMTTGDYMTWRLTGRRCLSSSDALSNGLLKQASKQLATETITAAGLDPGWFPSVVQSGSACGTILTRSANGLYHDIARILDGWTVRAPLGDNHASGVGSGLDDDQTMVISLGSSGTVIRKCRHNALLAGNAASFEYFADKLLLKMLADCAVWYNRFLKRFAGASPSLPSLNEVASATEAANWLFVPQAEKPGGWEELYPDRWDALTLAEKVASVQASIAIHMLRLVRDLLSEVRENAPPITQFVLTGGLSQSQLMQHVLATGLNQFVPGCKVMVSGRQGPLANKAAVLGAMLTAMVGTPGYPNLSAVIKQLCTLEAVAMPLATIERIGQEDLVKFIWRNL
ncbi:MAG: FGGY family carbohydrate kinase [bacterium]|nr:FGGY family carbohydrate kinase [bacterium]